MTKHNENQHPINEDILVYEQIRLVGEEDQDMNGIYKPDKALEMARERNEDLVQIALSGDVPVCRIVEYSKYRYELKKKEKEKKSKQHIVEVKEIRFGPATDDHDFEFKRKHAEKFLKEGDKVKAYVFFRGRSIVYQKYGLDLLAKFAEALSEYAKIETEPKLEGKRLFMILTPKK